MDPGGYVYLANACVIRLEVVMILVAKSKYRRGKLFIVRRIKILKVEHELTSKDRWHPPGSE